jgi:hypothetical protein
MTKVGMDREIGLEYIFENLDDALKKARKVVGAPNGDNGGKLLHLSRAAGATDTSDIPAAAS